MSTRRRTLPSRTPRRPTADPAHAPGKHHLAHGAGGGTRTIDQHVHQRRTSEGTASIHNRRAERGR